VASSSPDLNLAEYGQGMLRKLLNDAIRDGKEEWRGNAKKKMAVVKRLVEQLNTKKWWFQRLYDGHADRCRKVLQSDGGLTAIKDVAVDVAVDAAALTGRCVLFKCCCVLLFTLCERCVLAFTLCER